MADEIIKTETDDKGEPVARVAPVVAVESGTPVAVVPKDEKRPVRGAFRDRQPLRKKNFRRSGRPERARQEFDQKIINIRRVARVSSGGRRFSFSVAMIIGNRRGSVGVGTGKGADTAIAIDKALRNAKQNLVKIATTPSSSIAHRIEAKYSSARVMLMPSPGRGVVAGSAARSVLELAGIKDITAKIFSPSKKGRKTARATIEARARLKTFGGIAPVVKGESPKMPEGNAE